MYVIFSFRVSILYTEYVVYSICNCYLLWPECGSSKRLFREMAKGIKISLSLAACFKKGIDDFMSHGIFFIYTIEYITLYFTVARPSSLIDSQTQEVLLADCISRDLKRALDQYNLDMSENFNAVGRYVVLSPSICFVFHHRVFIIASNVSTDYGVTL